MKSTRTTREEWTKRIERWKESGLTYAEYARELGISPGSLKWWKWRLEAERSSTSNGEKKPIRRRGVRRSRAASTPMTFVEVPRSRSAKAPIEIVLASRVRIRVQSDFDIKALERVLALLGVHQ